jgi:hemerythrin-like domain-containing protein
MSDTLAQLERSPIRAISLFIHKAILREAEGISAKIGAVSSSADAADVLQRIVNFVDKCHQHTSGEEKGLFTFIAQRWPKNDRPYLFDHKEERALLRSLQATAQQLVEGAGGAAGELRQQIRAVLQHISLHVRKEDDVLFGMIAEDLPPEEQKNIIRRMLASHTPEEVAQVVGWMVTVFNPDEREQFMRMRNLITPGPPFEALKQVVKGALPAEAWDDIVRRYPEAAIA